MVSALRKKETVFLAAALALLAAVLTYSFRPYGRRAKAEENTYRLSSVITDIHIDTSVFDVSVIQSEDGICTVTCRETDLLKHSVDLKSGVLTIVEEKREASVNTSGLKLEIEVRLPELDRSSLTVRTDSGSIRAAAGLSFDYVKFESAGGSIYTELSVNNEMRCRTESGSLAMSGTSPAKVSAETVSGDIRAEDMRGTDMDLQTVSGKAEISSAVVSGYLAVKTGSGDISLQECDAQTVYLKSVSGDIKGSLLSGKNFSVKTVSGHIDVPGSSYGGSCEIVTTSGDAEIVIG